MADISMIKCPHCKKEYQNFLATQLKAELAELKAKDLEQYNEWTTRVEKAEAELDTLQKSRNNLIDEFFLLKTENKRHKEALGTIKDKAWDYTSPPMSEKIRVFAGITHKIANRALNPKEKP